MLLYYISLIESDDDQSKFTRLYSNYKYTMFHTAYKILKDQYLAEDAIHQAFLKIVNNLSKIDETNVPKTKSFLVVITRNVAKDIYCEHFGRGEEEKDISLEDIDDLSFTFHQRSVESEVMEQYNVERIIDAIESLPEIYSDLLRLKYTQELSDHKIAELLGLPYDTVRKRLQRAKLKLAQAIQDRGTQAYVT